jgi:hypothetical protein
VSAAGRPCSPGEAPRAVNFLNLLNFRGIRKSRKIASEDGLGVMGVPAYTTGHRERYLAYGSRPPMRRSWTPRYQLVNR